MKGLFLVSSIFVITLSSFAQTVVSGNITGVWSATNDPYIVAGDLML